MTPLAARLAEIRGRLDAATWQPIETAPKDAGPILALCDRHAAPGHVDGPDGEVWDTTYARHADWLGAGPDGIHIIEWGGEYDQGDDLIPDWWFVRDTEFESPVYPTHWMPLPPPPDAAAPTDVRELVAEVERLGALATVPLLKSIERILDGHSAWIAQPSADVTLEIAIAAGMAGMVAHQRGGSDYERHLEEKVARLTTEAAAVRAGALEEAAQTADRFVIPEPNIADQYDRPMIEHAGKTQDGIVAAIRALATSGAGGRP